MSAPGCLRLVCEDSNRVLWRRMPEYTKLEFIKVSRIISPHFDWLTALQEIGFTHMRVLEGVGTLVQLAGLVARLCKMVSNDFFLLSSF